MAIAPSTMTTIQGMDDRRAVFTYSGDLGQMGSIEEFLRGHGMPVVKTSVFPGFVEEADYIAGLKLIWEHRVAGWWNQQPCLLKHQICTEDEYRTALDEECAKRK